MVETVEAVIATTARVLFVMCLILVALDAFRARPLYCGMFPHASPLARVLVFVAAWAITVGIVWLAWGGTAVLFHGTWAGNGWAAFIAVIFAAGVGLPLGAFVARSVQVMIVGESQW